MESSIIIPPCTVTVVETSPAVLMVNGLLAPRALMADFIPVFTSFLSSTILAKFLSFISSCNQYQFEIFRKHLTENRRKRTKDVNETPFSKL